MYWTLNLGVAVVRLHRRSLLMGASLSFLALALAFWALILGDYGLSAGEVFRTLSGHGSDALGSYFVIKMRLPRIIAALAVGSLFGLSGAIFQALTRNPLGSPDITGFTAGSATGAILSIVLLGLAPWMVSLGALLGGCLAGLVVFTLARSSKLDGINFVLIGIGLSFILQALNSLLLVRTQLNVAQAAAQWLAGSLSTVRWDSAVFVTLMALGIGVIALLLARDLDVLLCGEELAVSLGVPVMKRKIQLIALGIIASAIAVAVCGPVSFVALAAPQISRRLCRSSSAGLWCAAVVGAVLVLISDIAAQRLFAPTQLPVGVITGAAGGAYLVILLLFQEFGATKLGQKKGFLK